MSDVRINTADNLYSKGKGSITNADQAIAKFMEKGNKTDEAGNKVGLNEMEMVELNLLVSRRTTSMTMFTNAIKSITDSEKQAANKI